MNKAGLLHIIFPKVIYLLAALCVLLPWMSAPMALCLGLILALIIPNPFENFTQKYTKKFLAWSIVGLGAGMNLEQVLQIGAQGIYISFLTIALAILAGFILYKIVKTNRDTSVLITVGTAICGGSAIAALAPVIKADSRHITLALAIVFILNALALFTFPWLGQQLGLSQTQFGIWSALAIHDTSSVIGTGMVYGPEALEIATTTKLSRALWIIPVTLIIAYIYNRKEHIAGAQKPVEPPWFIGGFLIMAALVTWLPWLQPYGLVIEQTARRLLVLTLFMIGTGLTISSLKQVGIRPFVLGILLWVMVAGSTLVAVKAGYITLTNLGF